MAARSIFLQLLVLGGLGLAGCATKPSTCYVTLSPIGAPTAEACESGSVLMVRPITETNAAYYVPPYVIGALSYEGFLEPYHAAEDGGLGEEDDTSYQAAEDLSTVPMTGESFDDRFDVTSKLPGAMMTGKVSTSPQSAMTEQYLQQSPEARENDATSAFTAVMTQPTPSDSSNIAEPAADAPLVRGPAPANRLVSPHPTIDGEVRYLRPFEGYESFPIAPDLLL